MNRNAVKAKKEILDLVDVLYDDMMKIVNVLEEDVEPGEFQSIVGNWFSNGYPFDYSFNEVAFDVGSWYWELQEKFNESFNRKNYNSRRRLRESLDDEKKNRLEDYLNSSGDSNNVTVESIFPNVFETSDEREYWVLDDTEADDEFEDSVRSSIEELGLDAFTDDFKNWILDNAIDYSNLTPYMENNLRGYCEDIQHEPGDDGFKTRLEKELYDNDVLTDSDFVTDKNGNKTLKPELKNSIPDYIDNYVSNFCDEYDPVEWYIDTFGIEDFNGFIKEYPYTLDMDSIIDEVFNSYGRGLELASYDGNEIDLGNGLFAYRTN